jgi:lambda family phage portal protein
MREAKRKKPAVTANFIDRAVNFFSPVAGARRLRARLAMEIFNAYDGASKTKRSLKEWLPYGNDANSDILPDLAALRERSRDLVRNNPIAAGAIKTKVTNVIGTGFVFKSMIDRHALNISDDQAEELESQIEREWRLFWNSKDVDISRTCAGPDLCRMIYQQAKENGDVFCLLPRVARVNSAYDLRLQVVEADRVCNPNDAMDSDTLAGGIERDATTGEPIRYHIMKQHPGGLNAAKNEWQARDAFGAKTGLPSVIHLFSQTRPGQSRGVPDLAPVIEALKQLGRYTEAEIMAAVVAGLFTVFIETDGGADVSTFDYSRMSNETGQKSSDKDVKLGNGLIMELGKGEKINIANPGRPNNAFDPFIMAILRQVGTALEIPFEILIKHFTASYSAARAALLAMWQYVMSERRWFADNFLKVVLEVWMWEAVATGRIAAPGFFADPGVRAAYLGCKWIGPSKGQINELAEVKAAQARVDGRLSTLAAETAELTGGDWEQNHIQQVKEHRRQLKDGLAELPETGGPNE